MMKVMSEVGNQETADGYMCCTVRVQSRIKLNESFASESGA